MSMKKNWQKPPLCHKEAENLDTILLCDGADSIEQIGHKVGVKLNKENPNQARICHPLFLPRLNNSYSSLDGKQFLSSNTSWPLSILGEIFRTKRASFAYLAYYSSKICHVHMPFTNSPGYSFF